MTAYKIVYQKSNNRENKISTVILLNASFSIVKEDNLDLVVFSDIRLGTGHLLSLEEIEYSINNIGINDSINNIGINKSIDESKIIDRKK